MGAPARIVVPDPSQQVSSPAGSTYSPTETESCSSLSSTDISSSSFAQSSAHGADSASTLSPKSPSQSPKTVEEKHHRKKKHVLDGKVCDCRQMNNAEVKQIKQGACKEPLRETKRALMDSHKSCTVRGSKRKACCRCVGAFAADCAALCCCPCAIFSLLSFILVEFPSGFASKMMTHLKKRLCLKDSLTVCNSRNEDNSPSVFTSTWSYKESCEGIGEQQAVSIIRFDTQNLLKHFEAENVGFGCLSQKRE